VGGTRDRRPVELFAIAILVERIGDVVHGLDALHARCPLVLRATRTKSSLVSCLGVMLHFSWARAVAPTGRFRTKSTPDPRSERCGPTTVRRRAQRASAHGGARPCCGIVVLARSENSAPYWHVDSIAFHRTEQSDVFLGNCIFIAALRCSFLRPSASQLTVVPPRTPSPTVQLSGLDVGRKV
jgi:hypothetical protein